MARAVLLEKVTSPRDHETRLLVSGLFQKGISSLTLLPSFPLRNLPHSVAPGYGEETAMGNVRSIDRRSEARVPAELGVTIWGVDTKGDRFLQEARAREISLSGALLTGLDVELRSGDVVGILYANRKARFRVIWVHHIGATPKLHAAVHRIEPDLCPWQALLAEEGSISKAPAHTDRPEKS